ncbi:hypothetical protein Tco_0772238 [Tanacetum coccineum]|uniref:Reverse transcriptase Ty1/copia-type domain-containing protein n=1 Tax=Tanacetum coccineum TaxID=301880 RepID=A0ABQ4ZK91_9ASTR
MSSIGELTFFLGLQVKQKEDGIYISQDKYVGEILKKFGFSSIRTASTPMETNKALTKDEDGEDVDIHLYRSMIRSLMYLTSSRPGYYVIRLFQSVTMHGASLDKNLTTGGCTISAGSSASTAMVKCLWIQIDVRFGYNFMQTKIHVDNESAICVVKNPNTYRLQNVENLLTKAFDVTRFQFLIASIELQGYLINDGYVDLVRMLVTLLILLMFTLIELLHTNGHQFHLSNTTRKIGLIPGQTTTGKDISNPLMAGSLPKTIMDFLSTCSINYALTVSPTIYASYIEQFWNTATSKIINSVKQIHAIVDGKAVVISESIL